MFNKIILASLFLIPSAVVGSEMSIYGYIDGVASTSDANNNHNGVDSTISLYPHSSIMLGGDYIISDIVTAQAQIVASGNAEGEPTGFIDIASLTFGTPYNTDVVIGKQRLPISMHSNKLYRGIDTTWITLPESVYDHQLPNSYTGASAVHSFQWRDINLNSSVYVGSADKRVKQTHILPDLFTESMYTNIAGGSVFISHSPVQYFVSYMQGEHRSEFNELLFASMSSQTQIVDNDSFQRASGNSDVEFKGVGVSYEVGSAFTLSAEVLDKSFESGFINSTLGFYASVAYKFRVISLAATFAEEQFRDEEDELSDLQSQFILTGSYQLTPKLKLAAEYTHTNSKVRQNPNFEERVDEDGVNQLSLAVQYRF